jgi:hypothetical protein
MSSQDGDGGAGRMSAGEEEDQGRNSTTVTNHKHSSSSSAGANNNNHNDDSDRVIGSAALRPVFLGNLMPEYAAEVVFAAFEQPTIPHAEPVYVDRVDIKRGYCFVFLKDARSQSDKRRIEEFVSKINGMYVFCKHVTTQHFY